jgi:hemolysin activation/secretion protein
MALGAVVSWKGVSYELFYAQPIASPAFFDREGPQLFFRLNLSV